VERGSGRPIHVRQDTAPAATSRAHGWQWIRHRALLYHGEAVATARARARTRDGISR